MEWPALTPKILKLPRWRLTPYCWRAVVYGIYTFTVKSMGLLYTHLQLPWLFQCVSDILLCIPIRYTKCVYDIYAFSRPESRAECCSICTFLMLWLLLLLKRHLNKQTNRVFRINLYCINIRMTGDWTTLKGSQRLTF